MARRLIRLVIVVALFQPQTAVAQESVTLRDIVSAMDEARTRSNLVAVDPEIDAELGAHLDVLRSSGMLEHTAVELAAATRIPRMSAIARTASGTAPQRVVVALYEVKGLRNNEVREALEAATSVEEARRVLAPVTAFQTAQLDLSIEDSVRVLRMYERKFGPASARLNGIEVLLNYAMQRLPGFGPNAASEPGPLEVIASYSPTYLTYGDGEPRMVSVSELGLRHYFFGESWGGSGLKGVIRPAYMTAGLAVASEDDGAMRWPWRGDARLGGFVSWGQLKVAYVAGENQRLMVSRQFQIVPWAF